MSISPTFYKQLLRSQRSRKRKKQLNLTVFFALLGSARLKAARKTLVKLTPGHLFTRHFFCDCKRLLMQKKTICPIVVVYYATLSTIYSWSLFFPSLSLIPSFSIWLSLSFSSLFPSSLPSLLLSHSVFFSLPHALSLSHTRSLSHSLILSFSPSPTIFLSYSLLIVVNRGNIFNAIVKH